jgi:hypothetical protein
MAQTGSVAHAPVVVTLAWEGASLSPLVERPAIAARGKVLASSLSLANKLKDRSQC